MPRIPNNMFPAISPGGYGYTGPSGAMRTEVAGGMPRYALDYDRGVQQFNVALMLTTYQMQIWTLFYYNTIKQGTISFDMPLDSGNGVIDHVCNIVPNSYSVTYNHANIAIVTFTVEAESSAYTYADSADALVSLYNDNVDPSELFNQLEQFATVDSNVLGF